MKDERKIGHIITPAEQDYIRNDRLSKEAVKAFKAKPYVKDKKTRKGEDIHD